MKQETWRGLDSRTSRTCYGHRPSYLPLSCYAQSRNWSTIAMVSSLASSLFASSINQINRSPWRFACWPWIIHWFPWPTLAELIDHLDSFLNSGANRLCFSYEENQGPIILFPSIQPNSSIRIPRTHGRKKLGSKLIMIPEVVMLLENLMHSSRKSESRHNGKPTGIRQPILPVSLTIISQRDTFCHSDLCKLQFWKRAFL